MDQSPSRDFTAASASLNASVSEGMPSSSRAPRKRQFRQRPLARREPELHSPHNLGSSRIENGASMGEANSMTSYPPRVERSAHRYRISSSTSASLLTV